MQSFLPRPVLLLLWLPLVLLAALLFAAPLPAQQSDSGGEPEWLTRSGPGLRLDYTPRDRNLARRLWAEIEADRRSVMERLRMFPTEEVRIVLTPDRDAFEAALGGTPPHGTLGVYLLGQRTIVLRSPRTDLAGGWDLRGVLRHELAHAVIDVAIAQPVPLWLHEGLAILVSDELDYLDEAQLSTVAVLRRLIPLPRLFASFPAGHGARTLAYAQAASFVRFLLRQGGMGGLHDLLRAFGTGLAPEDAFAAVYGEGLAALESRWQDELSGRFSYVTLLTTSSVLGGVGLPLLLLAVARRWLQRRRAYRRWEAEEAQQAAALPAHGRVAPPGGDGEAAGGRVAPPGGPPVRLKDGWS